MTSQNKDIQALNGGESSERRFDFSALQRNDPTEIRKLAEALSPGIRVLASRRGMSSWDAEDVAMEVILKVIDSDRLASLNDSAQILPYAMILARNAVMHFQRRDRRNKDHSEFHESFLEDHVPEPAIDVSDALQATIQKALDNLSEPDRRILSLHYFKDVPIETIATKLSISVEVVQKRLYRARTRLRDAIELAEYSPDSSE